MGYITTHCVVKSRLAIVVLYLLSVFLFCVHFEKIKEILNISAVVLFRRLIPRGRRRSRDRLGCVRIRANWLLQNKLLQHNTSCFI